MADNSDFYKVLCKNVKLVYPKLNGTYRFNTGKQQSEACPPTAQGAAWSISWTVPVEEARALHTQLKAHYEACRARSPKLPAFTKIFGSKKSEDGQTVTFAAKRTGTKGDGTANTPPKVIDGAKNPLADLAIWSGSVGSIRAWAFPAVDPEGKGGISLILDTVQVTKPIYGDGGLDDFDLDHSAPKGDFDDFGPTPAPAAAPARVQEPSKPLNEVLGDDIPFD
jgi:hypothetical protein